MAAVLRIAVLALTLLVVFPQSASASPPPSGRFVVVSSNGSACRGADAPQVRPRGLTGVDVTFRALTARQGGGASAVNRRAACLITLRAVVARGYTFGVESVRLRGQATLSAGTTGVASARSWFLGQTATGNVSKTLNGPFAGAWEERQTVPPASIVWMPCDGEGQVSLALDVRVGSVGGRPGTTTGQVSMPSASYGFTWKRC